jgi:hypothetical protein
VCVPTQQTNDQLQRNLSTKKHEPKQVHHATQDNAKTKQKIQFHCRLKLSKIGKVRSRNIYTCQASLKA